MGGLDRFLHAVQRIKPLSHSLHGSRARLKQCLTLFDLIAYGVGCSVGAGVYSLVGVGAQIAGPAVSLSFLISGVACIFTSLTYSEFAARIPITGSAYTFVYLTFGELAAWLVGWNLTLGYGISAAGIARSWAAYAEVFLKHIGITIPHWLVQTEIFGNSCSMLAAVLVISCTVILLAGVHESAKFNAFITGLNLVVLLFVISYGSTQVEAANWEPFMPEGFHGVMTGAGVVFFAYLGFDMVACLAEEVQEPQKTLPKGIIGSLLISMGVYVGVSLVVTGMAPVSALGGDVPLVNAFLYHNVPWAGKIVSFGSIFGLTTAAFTCLMGQPRIFYQMAKDGLLPEVFSNLNRRTQVPVASTIFTGILVACVSFVFDLNFLANVISCGTLQVFTFVNAGVLLLRLEPPISHGSGVINRVLCFVVTSLTLSLSFVFDLHWIAQALIGLAVIASFGSIQYLEKIPQTSSAFQCPWVPLIPCLGILANIYMLASLPLAGWLGVAIWLTIGLLVYLCYGIRHSALNDNSAKRSQSMKAQRDATIQYLLRFAPADELDTHENEEFEDEETAYLYPQARPLVHSQSSAVVKTLGKILDDPVISQHMLQRQQASLQPDSPAKSLSSKLKMHVKFQKACEYLMASFDSQARNTGQISVHKLKPLLQFHALHVDPVAYRQWEQTLPLETEDITVLMLMQACSLWFGEKYIVEHCKRINSLTAPDIQQQQEHPDRHRLDKCQSAPLLHPFDLMTQKSDATRAFSYEDYAKYGQQSPHANKTTIEQHALKSKAVIEATQHLRRKTKILGQTPLPPSASLQAALSPAPVLHDRLHEEKLARHILRRCASHSLVPSNRKKSMPQLRELKAQQLTAKQLRQQNVATATAFSASIAMISRHVQNEELRDLRDSNQERQMMTVDERKQLNRLHQLHCRTMAQEKKQQQLREVHAMKAIAVEELELVRNYIQMRQDILKYNKQPFVLSSSTSTIFQQPPEILAAKATAKTVKQKKMLSAIEREHMDHVRSVQLFDYVYEKKHAMLEALKPKVDAALIDLADTTPMPEELAAKQSEQEAWQQLLLEHADDVSALVPPPNSPPAALRYFGSSRPVFLPPFASSVDRNLS